MAIRDLASSCPFGATARAAASDPCAVRQTNGNQGNRPGEQAEDGARKALAPTHRCEKRAEQVEGSDPQKCLPVTRHPDQPGARI